MSFTDCSAVISRVTTSAIRPYAAVQAWSVAVSRRTRMSHSWTWTPFVVECLSDAGPYGRAEGRTNAAWN